MSVNICQKANLGELLLSDKSTCKKDDRESYKNQYMHSTAEHTNLAHTQKLTLYDPF